MKLNQNKIHVSYLVYVWDSFGLHIKICLTMVIRYAYCIANDTSNDGYYHRFMNMTWKLWNNTEENPSRIETGN